MPSSDGRRSACLSRKTASTGAAGALGGRAPSKGCAPAGGLKPCCSGREHKNARCEHPRHPQPALPADASRFLRGIFTAYDAGWFDIAARTDSAADSKLFAKQMTQMARMDAVRPQVKPVFGRHSGVLQIICASGICKIGHWRHSGLDFLECP